VQLGGRGRVGPASVSHRQGERAGCQCGGPTRPARPQPPGAEQLEAKGAEPRAGGQRAERGEAGRPWAGPQAGRLHRQGTRDRQT